MSEKRIDDDVARIMASVMTLPPGPSDIEPIRLIYEALLKTDPDNAEEIATAVLQSIKNIGAL
ncbi:hypothetical protein [Methylobacterium iners]|uniref:Uncharacterized protein n=1 Tax=Methylobacterium iners TaxID=418707 RepID=A0ABQ4RVD4_9HYPH|nr:hypothetical protein [Methylobacterium iners]GJD94793.1 hypothetical protein OCOJLMKI_1997 [Methylobacterium iners]